MISDDSRDSAGAPLGTLYLPPAPEDVTTANSLEQGVSRRETAQLPRGRTCSDGVDNVGRPAQ